MIINMNALPQDQFTTSNFLQIQTCPYPPNNSQREECEGEGGNAILTGGSSQQSVQPLSCHYSSSPFDDGAAISEFKSWLRQTQSQPIVGPINTSLSGGNQIQSLSLSVNPMVGPLDEVVVVDTKKRGQSKSLSNGGRELVPRKSLDTFGQRTSQYRGVTKYVCLSLSQNITNYCPIYR